MIRKNLTTRFAIIALLALSATVFSASQAQAQTQTSNTNANNVNQATSPGVFDLSPSLTNTNTSFVNTPTNTGGPTIANEPNPALDNGINNLGNNGLNPAFNNTGSFVDTPTNTGGPTIAGAPTNTTPPQATLTQPAAQTTPGACASVTGGINVTNCINSIFANVINIFLSMAAFILGLAGSVMNASIVLTLHISDFVNATPAIFTVWQTLRDITGIFFIFYLLYAAIQMILGDEAKFGHTITNIVVAGILINFSFFLVSVGIDASNIVSQAIYNQMFPNSSVSIQGAQNGQQGTNLSTIVQNAEVNGHISDVFMNSLQVSKLYDPKANNGNGGVVTGGLILGPLKIILIGITGVMMMLTTAISFVIAACAFIIRLAVLIFILGFSPMLFLSWMSPELKEHTGKIGKYLQSQLIFMPVYLLLMYVALEILNNSNILGAASTQSSNFMPTGTNWAFPFIVLAMNFVLVIFMLNLPLVVGIGMSGFISEKTLKKFSAKNLWKNFGSQVGSRTAGRLAYGLNEKITPKLAAASPLLGSLSNSAFSSVSKAGFGVKKGGYEDKLKAKKKSEEELHKAIGDRMKNEGYSDKDIKDAQAKYRAKLPWKSGVIGIMLDNRAHVETQKKLDKEVKKKENAKDLKINRKARSDKEEELKQLKEEIRKQEAGIGLKPGIPATADQIAKREKLEKEIKELEDKIDDGEEQKHKDDLEDFASKVKDGSKGDGGGEKKEGGDDKK